MLAFDEATHTYHLNGKRLPSVTQVLDVISSYMGIPADILAKASARGNYVHTLTEHHDNGVLGEYDVEYEGYLLAWKTFLQTSGFEPELVEFRMADEKIGAAGTLDRYGSVIKKGALKKILLDIKSTAVLVPSVGPQTAAYEKLLKASLPEIKVDERWCVLLKPDGSFKKHNLTSRADWATFRAALTIHQWKEENIK